MKIKKITHIGVGVKDAEKAGRLFQDFLSLPVSHEEMVGELKVAFVPVGETNLELVQSTDSAGVMNKFIEKGGRESITSPWKWKTSTPPWKS